MQFILFDSDAAHVRHMQAILQKIVSDTDTVLLNPAFPIPLSKKTPADHVLFLIDTRYHTAEGNFLTLARKIRESNDQFHICFLSPSPADIGFCYKRLVKPSGFLLKPVDPGELRALITEINVFCTQKKPLADTMVILLHTRGDKRVVRISRILFFTTYNKKVLCHTEDNEVFSFYGTLGQLEKKYNAFFLRCHSGFLVNKHKITNFSKAKMLLTVNGSKENIPVSKSRCKTVENCIQQLTIC